MQQKHSSEHLLLYSTEENAYGFGMTAENSKMFYSSNRIIPIFRRFNIAVKSSLSPTFKS